MVAHARYRASCPGEDLIMPDKEVGRRDFMKRVGVIGAASATTLASVPEAIAQGAPPPPLLQSVPTPSAAIPPAGYTYLKPAEAEFIESLVDHMVPKDELTPSGTEIGIATYIDRALAGSWGKGARMYTQGPWGPGTPNQGYQLPLTPDELYRAAIAGSNAYCRKTFGADFAKCDPAQKESFLKDLQGGKITLEGGLPGRVFFGVLYTNVMEGLFADPIYGGNKDKIGWKLIGFPGVIANNAEHVKQFSDGQRFPANPVSIGDMS
jgi:gluconate 2-dehydrogenase gamma chain